MRTIYIALQGGKIVSIFGSAQGDPPDGYQEIDITDESPDPEIGGTISGNVCQPVPQVEKDAVLIEQKVKTLWAAADAYVNNYISGVAVGMLTIGVILQLPKALAVTAWVNSIWSEYYIRKAAVTAADPVDLDFNTFGDIPHSIPELREELRVAQPGSGVLWQGVVQ